MWGCLEVGYPSLFGGGTTHFQTQVWHLLVNTADISHHSSYFQRNRDVAIDFTKMHRVSLIFNLIVFFERPEDAVPADTSRIKAFESFWGLKITWHPIWIPRASHQFPMKIQHFSVASQELWPHVLDGAEECDTWRATALQPKTKGFHMI